MSERDLVRAICLTLASGLRYEDVHGEGWDAARPVDPVRLIDEWSSVTKALFVVVTERFGVDPEDLLQQALLELARWEDDVD